MIERPSGTITFLFSDIEGSTRLWEAHPTTMKSALARHDFILRETIEKSRGYVFKTVGDAFCAAFASAIDAINASIEIQERIGEEPWELSRPIKVRIAIHSGVAEYRDNDYFGPTLNRTARLESLAFGGQTILSLVTEELIRDHLPVGAELATLGNHRLKDLTRPETIYELRVAGQEESFPPLKSLDSHPHNLPLEATPLIGRERDLENLEAQLRSGKTRLLTLAGPGGIGKTRMSLQIAADLIDDFPDGAFVVDLAPIRQAEQVPRAIAETLHVRESAELPLPDHLRDWLANRRILLIFDNFEQVVEGGAYVATLLTSCANMCMIATSREPLRLRGERVFHVPPLGLPNRDNLATNSIERLSQYDAVRLFIERATDVNPAFGVTNENAPAVAELCVHLDGLPLALELAAARISMLTPESLLKHLGERLTLLSGGARDLPTRQQTLRNTIDWSYELLSGPERSLFAGFAIFYGGFTIEAAEAVCAKLGFDLGEILEITQSLVEKSLVVSLPLADGDTRFYLLETIREYGREHLEREEKLKELARTHAEYYLRLAVETGSQLEGPNPGPFLSRLDRDVENVRHAVRFFSNQRDFVSASRLIISLGRYWQQRGYLSEARAELETITQSDDGVPDDLLVRARCWASLFAREQGDLRSATELLETALSLARSNKDQQGIAFALHEAGWTAHRGQDVSSASQYFSECQQLAEQLGDELLQAKARFGLATVDLLAGKPGAVRERLEEARETFHRGGHLRLETQALANLALVAYQGREFEEAVTIWTRLLTMYEELGDTALLPWMVNNIGEALINLQRWDEAFSQFERLDAISRFTDNKRLLALAKIGQGEALLGNTRLEEGFAAVNGALELLGRQDISTGFEIGQCLRVRGDILAAMDRKSEAAKDYERAVALLEDTATFDELQKAHNGLRAVSQ